MTSAEETAADTCSQTRRHQGDDARIVMAPMRCIAIALRGCLSHFASSLRQADRGKRSRQSKGLEIQQREADGAPERMEQTKRNGFLLRERMKVDRSRRSEQKKEPEARSKTREAAVFRKRARRRGRNGSETGDECARVEAFERVFTRARARLVRVHRRHARVEHPHACPRLRAQPHWQGWGSASRGATVAGTGALTESTMHVYFQMAMARTRCEAAATNPQLYAEVNA
eukprot:3975962-Pleurochrysis_carterae.AAC.1